MSDPEVSPSPEPEPEMAPGSAEGEFFGAASEADSGYFSTEE